MWPEEARAREARAPKPLDAPVTTITFFIVFLPPCNGFLENEPDLDFARRLGTSDHAAVSTKDLPIDPAAVRADEKRHCRRNVLGRPQALQGIHFCHVIDELLGLSVQEQVRGRWA